MICEDIYLMLNKHAVLIKQIVNKYENSDNGLYDIGYKYAGPILYIYTFWILSHIKQKQINKLYFIARDGYPLYQISKYLIDYYKLSIECKYLYCSRKSLVLASTINGYEDELHNLTKYSVQCSLDIILDRIDATNEQKQHILIDLKNNNFEIELDTILTLDIHDKLQKYLISNDYYIATIKANALKCYNNTVGYLKQEAQDLYTSNSYIVDIGWAGSIQKYLNKIIKYEEKNIDINAFYFGTLNSSWFNKHKNLYSSWYFSADNNFLYCLPFSINIMEKICTAPHGSTLKYVEEDGLYKPILHNINKKEEEQTLNINNGIIDFVKAVNNLTSFNDFITMIYSDMRGGVLQKVQIAS